MSRFHAAGVAAALLTLPFTAVAATSQEFKAGDLMIRTPWARATPGGAQVAGGYLTVINNGNAPDRLTGGSLEAASQFELHEMSTENGIMKMRPTGPLEISPGGTLTLSPAGKHIMFTGLKHPLKKGDEVAGTLSFEHAGTVAVHFKVEGIGAKAPSGQSGHAGQSMPGMDMN